MEILMFLIFVAFMTISAGIIAKKKKSGNYDERQELIRNRGYKYGFATTAFAGIIILFLKVNLSKDLMVIIPLYAGALVISMYDILNGAYFRIREKHSVFNGFLLMAVGIVEGYFGWSTAQNKEDIEVKAMFILLALFFILTGATILYVTYRDKRED